VFEVRYRKPRVIRDIKTGFLHQLPMGTDVRFRVAKSLRESL
jgi:nucleoid DNA-binding protein